MEGQHIDFSFIRLVSGWRCYPDIVLRLSDGHRSSSQTIDIEVTNVNQAPQLIPMPVLSGREGMLLQFTIAGGDFDADALVYDVVAGMPQGADFNHITGMFSGTPGYEQAGSHTVTFAAYDPEGLSDTTDVELRVANVNRAPVLHTSDHWATLGQPLRFFATATDPDLNTTLSFHAEGLPEGVAKTTFTKAKALPDRGIPLGLAKATSTRLQSFNCGP